MRTTLLQQIWISILPEIFDFLAEVLLKFDKNCKSDKVQEICYLFRDNWDEVDLIDAN